MQTSDYLCARPSFAEGMARIMDFGNALGVYNASGAPGASGDSNASAPESDPDAAALRADWAAIGEDFRHAVDQFTTAEADRLAAANEAARKR